MSIDKDMSFIRKHEQSTTSFYVIQPNYKGRVAISDSLKQISYGR